MVTGDTGAGPIHEKCVQQDLTMEELNVEAVWLAATDHHAGPDAHDVGEDMEKKQPPSAFSLVPPHRCAERANQRSLGEFVAIPLLEGTRSAQLRHPRDYESTPLTEVMLSEPCKMRASRRSQNAIDALYGNATSSRVAAPRIRGSA